VKGFSVELKAHRRLSAGSAYKPIKITKEIGGRN
jgi:hypothetical protein